MISFEQAKRTLVSMSATATEEQIDAINVVLNTATKYENVARVFRAIVENTDTLNSLIQQNESETEVSK